MGNDISRYSGGIVALNHRLTIWQPFGLQPPLVVGVQKLRCAQQRGKQEKQDCVIDMRGWSR